MLEITMFPPAIGGDISPRGNPRILAIDEKTGMVVAIEIESGQWKNALAKLNRLEGVGITPANARQVREFGKPNEG